MPLVHPAGGLVYHGRALRSVHGRWSGFRGAIEAWLSEWEVPKAGLLLVGPSGGYSLPTSWLSEFDEVVAIDFDPLARWIFGQRHRGVRLKDWIADDTFPCDENGVDWEPLRRRLKAYPDHAVLFSNVLGQIALSASSEEAVERSFVGLRAELQGRRWASYHDRLSAPIRPRLPCDTRDRSDVELARCAYPSGGEIGSHSTGLFGRGLDCQTFAWECQKGHWNLIEGCRSR